MGKINYIEIIKQSAQNINFDNTAKHIFEDYVNWLGNDKKFLNVIKSLPNDNFYEKIKGGNFTRSVTRIFSGLRNNDLPQSFSNCTDFDTKSGKLNCTCMSGLEPVVISYSIVDNPENYVKQLFNLAHASGADVKFGYPKNGKQYHILIETSFGVVVYLSEDKQNRGYFQTLLARYISYNEMLYNVKIQSKNKKEAINKLIKNKLKRQLYEHLKNVYQNIDFIYAILTYLNDNKKVNLFLKMIEKNESFVSGIKMGTDILRYLSDAYYLYEKPVPENISFLSDRIKKVKESEEYGELFKKLIPIYKNEEEIYCTILEISSKQDYENIIKLIDSGLKDKNLIDTYCYVSRAKYLYSNNNQERGKLLLQHAIEGYEDNEYFMNIEEKMLKGEKI